MALITNKATRTPRRQDDSESGMESLPRTARDASFDYEDNTASGHDAHWLCLLEQAVDLAGPPIVHKSTTSGGIICEVVARNRLYLLKSPREYASMEMNQIHPAVLIQLNYLLERGRCLSMK